MPEDPRGVEQKRAAREVEADFEELGDPEAAPPLPSSTLAAQAATRLEANRLEANRLEANRRAAGPRAPTTLPLTAEILKLSWPVMLAQVLVSLAGLVDRAMVGRLDTEGGAAVSLAAVGFATQFFFLIQSALFAVSLACVALVARAIGAGDPQRARQALGASLEVGLVVTLILSGLMLIWARPALELLGARPNVIEAALPYLYFLVGSSVLLAASLVIDSALRANRDMRTPMWIALVITAAKLAGNWVFIFGNLGSPRLELVGAGFATALSQGIGLVIFVWVVVRQKADSPLAIGWRDLGRTGSLRREVIRISLPGIAERVIMNLAMLSYFWVLSRFYGTVAVAAYTVGVALLSFSWIPGTGYSQACATLIGQALGARDARSAVATGWVSARLAVVTAVALGSAVGIARYPLARLFTDDASVIAALGPFMLSLAIAQPFLQLHFTLGGAHRGAGDTWTPLVAAAIGNWLLRVPLACFFAIVLETDLLWVWLALIADHVARAAHLTWSFRRGRWLTRLEGTGQ